MKRYILVVTLLLGLVVAGYIGPSPVQAQDVLTQHNDLARTGANLKETTLSPSTFATCSDTGCPFGKILTQPVDGPIYAQPLYMQGVEIDGQARNVVFVATLANTVYAFDADAKAQTKALWSTSLGDSVTLPDLCIGPRGAGPFGQSTYHDLDGEVGIIGTPVISREEQAIYAVAFTKQGEGKFTYTLHKLDIATGNSMGEQVIAATDCAGHCDVSSVPRTNSIRQCTACLPGTNCFQSNQHLQRSGLLLVNNMVYVAFAGFGDQDPYQGWLFGFDAKTLKQTPNIFQTTDASLYDYEKTELLLSGRGGIWMSGQAPAADEQGNIYFSTGNSTQDPRHYPHPHYVSGSQNAGKQFANSVIRLAPDLGRPAETDTSWFFTPCSTDYLSKDDLDLASSGVMLIPDTNLVIGGGKQSVLYILDRSQLGGYNQDDSGAASTICVGGGSCQSCDTPFTNGSDIRGTPVFWKNEKGAYLYLWPFPSSNGSKAGVVAYQLNGSTLTPVLPSVPTVPPVPFPGGILSISAHGMQDGILWGVRPQSSSNQQIPAGELHAFDALSLEPLWDSTRVPDDALGNFSNFAPPTIANGRVYMATVGSIEHNARGRNPKGDPAALVVYGLKP